MKIRMRSGIKLISLLAAAFSILFTEITAQVKITDGTLVTMNPNSILELESNDKGLLIPRVIINDLNQPAPLTAPVPSGMLVFSSGGFVTDGFYFWDGSAWTCISGSDSDRIPSFNKSSDDTLTKTRGIIFAENDITLTLPTITAADTGLEIVIKNAGTYTDLIKVRGNGPSLIDNQNECELLPGSAMTFVSRGLNWIIKNRIPRTSKIIDVGPGESFGTIYEAIDFLKEHMEEPTVIRIASDRETLPSTAIINLPYPLTIQGLSYGMNHIAAGPGLSGKPMFMCLSECYFKMLVFDATTLPGYGALQGEDAIRLAGSGTYHEIKDCTFDGFYNAIVDSTDAELWLFECDISNSQNTGLLVESVTPGVKVRVSETDFVHCKTGINLSGGSESDIQITSGVFMNETGDKAINYNPANFSFESLIISNNSWNREGTGISGFDFTRTDGRDANAYIENNPGIEGNTPHCKINVVDNSTTVTCTNSNTWYKADWTNTSEYKTNFNISGNRITYLPNTSRDMEIFLSGNVKVSNTNRVITICIVKNGNTSVRYGETALRITAPNQPFQFSTVVYVESVSQNDFFEMYCSSASPGDILTFQDINMFVTTEK